MAKKTQTFISHSSGRLESPGSKGKQIQYLVRVGFLIHIDRHLLGSSHGGRRARQLSGVSFVRALTPFIRTPPS